MITSLLADELFMVWLAAATMVVVVVSTVLAMLGVNILLQRVRTILTWIGVISIVLFAAVLSFNVTHFK